MDCADTPESLLALLGNTQLPNITKYKIPVITKQKPIGVTSKRPKGCICCWLGSPEFATPMRSFNKIRGEDPTMVIVPPKIAQKPIGISNRDIGNSVRTEIRLTTGKNNAAAPTFCMKDEITPTEPAIIGMIFFSVLPPTLNIYPAIIDINPVLSRPAPIIMTAIIEITALEANPSNKRDVSARLERPGI